MKSKTTRQEYESCPQMDDFRVKEQMELSDIPVRDDNKATRKSDAHQCVCFRDIPIVHDDNKAIRNDNTCHCLHLQGFTEFCVKSNLHGLKYVGERNNHISIRLLWAIAFTTAVLTAAYFITNVYLKWEESPVILTVDSRIAEVQEIPFPAVTICPRFVLTHHYANQLLDRTNKSFDFNLKMVQSFCKQGDVDWELADNEDEMAILQRFKENIRLKCEEIFFRTWMKIDYKHAQYIYSDYVSLTPTMNFDSRYCCMFNGMKPQLMYRNLSDNYLIMNAPNTTNFDWNVETGFNRKEGVNKTYIPLRPFKTGSDNGLNVYIIINDTYCNRKTNFELSIHNPGEAAEFFNTEFYAVTGGTYKYKVTPQLTRADKTLRHVKVKQRRCYFYSEKYLRFFRTYTQLNCLLDCLANISLAECNCLPEYLPDMDGVSSCNIYDGCLNDKYLSVFDGDRGEKCDCLPPCIELKYLVTEQYTPLGASQQNTHLDMHVYFAQSRFYPYHRSAIYTFSEMLANLGGLLGLFLGFSFLSIVEIFYFVCIGFCKFLRGRWRDLTSRCYSDKCPL